MGKWVVKLVYDEHIMGRFFTFAKNQTVTKSRMDGTQPIYMK